MECRVSEGEGNWELNRAALQMEGRGGRETDTANERQAERERERKERTDVARLRGGLDADLQQLLSLIPAYQK